jgi:hypothetical protein
MLAHAMIATVSSEIGGIAHGQLLRAQPALF